MQTKNRILALIAAAALVGALALGSIATTARASDGESGLLSRLHQLGQRLHAADSTAGHARHHDSMAALIGELDLSPRQQERMAKIHELMAQFHRGDSMSGLHEQFVGQLKSGRLDKAVTRQTIDGHLETLRSRAYALTDEMIALVDSLDARQRDLLIEHLDRGSY